MQAGKAFLFIIQLNPQHIALRAQPIRLALHAVVRRMLCGLSQRASEQVIQRRKQLLNLLIPAILGAGFQP